MVHDNYSGISETTVKDPYEGGSSVGKNAGFSIPREPRIKIKSLFSKYLLSSCLKKEITFLLC